ncbi:hypothetical protein EMPS_06996 [Entomortierella parvispora]|uniref:Myb-like, SWIRM and MPN domain-containing protein 1 n=1 Tax=Entomortierella parvispora TaxID=205924 RepID=A0A9P3HDS2_9FUNG|nr:hypothetical protein EMPS_06996 [Entomortierella parvispora]
MAEEDADVDIDIDIDIDSDGDQQSAHQQPTPLSLSSSDHATILPSRIEARSPHSTPRTTADPGSDRHSTPSQAARQGSMETDIHPVDDFVIPDWISQDYQAQVAAADMDEKSRKMIESMLAEEAFYANNGRSAPLGEHQSAAASWTRNISKSSMKSKHDSKKRKNSDDSSIRTKRSASEDSRLNAKLSSADLPSHNTRWTPEEDDRLREGILRHGYGNWKAIAAVVGTRNPLQVKNHARHLSVSDRIPHDMSTNTSDGEGLDRRSSAANSAEEDMEEGRDRRRRQPRSKKVKRIDASVGAGVESGYESFVRSRHRARSVTSESGNDDFTGSEFGATSGYDTDNDDDRSVSRSGSVGLGTPSPGLRPVYASSPATSFATSGSVSRGRNSSMDVDEDIDIDIDSTDDDAAARLNLARNLPPFVSSTKSRSISPFSNSSTRSRMSSEFDSDSDRELEDMDDEEETLESGQAQKRSVGSSPALSDTHGSSSDLYVNTNFNTSSSSINSVGTGGSYKPSLKDANYLQQQQQLQKGDATSSRHMSMDKIANSPKERRTVSFGAVHVAELQPDLNSYDEISSEDGGFEVAAAYTGLPLAPSPLSNPLYQHSHPVATNLSGARLPVQRLTSSINRQTPSIRQINPSQGGKTAYDGFSGKRQEGTSPQSQDSEEDDGEEEGSLGTGIKRSLHPAAGSLAAKKAQRPRPKPSAVAAATHSVSFQPQPTVIPSQDRALSASPSIPPSGSPTGPRILDKSIITEEEKTVHTEFFCNKASKTPERYQRIRNTILQAWEKSPTTYLTKTSVRSSLKDCGDVNAIGRVHSWLESIGAINVGMTASSPGASLARPRNGGNNSSKRRGHSEEGGWSSSSSSSAPKHRTQSFSQADFDDMASGRVNMPFRRRRVRNEKGEWVDERELEGRVIEHNVHSKKDSPYSSKRSSNLDDDLRLLDDTAFFERHGMTKEEMEEEYEQERLTAQNAKYFAASEVLPVNTRVPKHKRAQHLLRETRGFHEYEFDDGGGELEAGTGYDPFRLIPLRKYNQQNTAPFRVKVSSDAMLIMDFHSHLAETEVIGLLGGLYDEDERILFILGVFPCRSISTGLQCEMDPESDVEARSFFSSKGFVVVGWYHSHPTFEPNPSIRDIENQSDHQAMFRRHELGVEPFVGVIVSPFDPRNLSFLSKFQFLSVSEQFDDRLNCRLPFGYDREITRTNELSVSLFQQISDLVRYYRTYEHRVDLSKPLRRGGTTTRLDKLLQSLNHHIFVDENAAKSFLNKVRELVVRGFRLPPSSPASSSQPMQHPQQSHLPTSTPTLPSNMGAPRDTFAAASASSASSAPRLDRSLSDGAGGSGSTPFKGPFTATMMEIETELASASSSLSSLVSSLASSPSSSTARIVVDDTDPEIRL